MASIQQDPSGTFHICFRFGRQRFKRSLQTTDRRKADAAAVRIAENMRLVKTGRMDVPTDADIPTFLLSDGTLSKQPVLDRGITIGELFERYRSLIPHDALEQSSLKTARIHMQHVSRILGATKSLRSVSSADLQVYVTARSKEQGHRGTVSAATIRKEIATFSALWNWSITQGLISKPYPRKGLLFPKRTEKPPFQTVKQIERQIKTQKLTTKQADAIWEAAYLDTAELTELLEYVRVNAMHEFLYPMCLMAAHTGARRSELSRCKVTDLDLTGSTVTIHERKRSKSTRTTRMIPLSAKLNEVLTEWLKVKPESPFVFPELQFDEDAELSPPDENFMTPDKASHHLEIVFKGSRWENLRGWHVFRHSFISNCATQGVDQRFIDSWVGHQTDEQRRRYRHLFPDSQKQAIDSVFAG
jgi:integrase